MKVFRLSVLGLPLLALGFGAFRANALDAPHSLHRSKSSESRLTEPRRAAGLHRVEFPQQRTPVRGRRLRLEIIAQAVPDARQPERIALAQSVGAQCFTQLGQQPAPDYDRIAARAKFHFNADGVQGSRHFRFAILDFRWRQVESRA